MRLGEGENLSAKVAPTNHTGRKLMSKMHNENPICTLKHCGTTFTKVPYNS